MNTTKRNIAAADLLPGDRLDYFGGLELADVTDAGCGRDGAPTVLLQFLLNGEVADGLNVTTLAARRFRTERVAA